MKYVVANAVRCHEHFIAYHIRKKMKSIHFMKKCWTIYSPPKSPSPIYPKIAKSDLPSNRLYDLPPPEIAMSDTLKSSLAIYPPPPKSPSPIYPKIAKSDLPSNRLYDLPPPQIDLRVNRSWQQGKSDLAISGGVNHTDDLRVNRTWRFWGGKCTDDLRVNRTWRFRGGGKSYRRFEGKSDGDLKVNRTWQIRGGGGKSYRQFEGKSDLVDLKVKDRFWGGRWGG